MAKYLIRIYSQQERKYYYLTNKQDKAVKDVFGACFIYGKRAQARIFTSKEDAKHTIRKMLYHGTGNNAEIYRVKERTQRKTR